MGLGFDTRDTKGLELDSIWLGLPRPGLIETYGLLLDEPARWLDLEMGQSTNHTATSDGDPYLVTFSQPSRLSVRIEVRSTGKNDGTLILSINYGAQGAPWEHIDVDVVGAFRGHRVTGHLSLTRSAN